MLTRQMLRSYTACKAYIDDSRNRKTVEIVERFLAYAERHDPAMKIAAVEKYINGRPWKEIALEFDRTERALCMKFDRFLKNYNLMHK